MPPLPDRETSRHGAIASSGPVSTEGTATFHPQHWYELTQSCRVTHTYTNGVTVIVGQGQKDIPEGATFFDSEGMIYVDRGKLRSTPADSISKPLSASDVHLYQEQQPPSELPRLRAAP